jgi:hypothetical protein
MFCLVFLPLMPCPVADNLRSSSVISLPLLTYTARSFIHLPSLCNSTVLLNLNSLKLSSFFSKSQIFKVLATVILRVLYECETLFPSVREHWELTVLETESLGLECIRTGSPKSRQIWFGFTSTKWGRFVMYFVHLIYIRYLTLILPMWRIGWAPTSISIHIQHDATLHSLFISGNCSTYFGWYFHPSSGAHTTVSTACGICHTDTVICRYRRRVGTGLSLLWVAYVIPVWVCCG